MKLIETKLLDCYIIEPKKFGDDRGYFSPYFLQEEFNLLGFEKVVQANRSKSAKGVLRGLHFQKDPKCQAKIVEVLEGSVIDVVVDMRKNSKTYGQSIQVELSKENGYQLYVPRGFAHGFLSLEDNTVFQYLIDNDYSTIDEDGILYNDESLNINWEEIFKKYNIDTPLLSEKDLIQPKLKDSKTIFNRETRYLITGINGQLGHDINKELLKRNILPSNILKTDIHNMDITNKEEVEYIISTFKPDVIYHCAAHTAVDKAEEDERLVNKINVLGTKYIAESAKKIDAKLVYVSTDYVFDGTKEGLIKEEDSVNPKSVYGKTKYEGELEALKNPKTFVTRVSWVFGINGNNFIKTMLKLAETKKELNIVDDQIGSPTYTVDLAKILVDMTNTEKYGIYNVTNEEYCSWAEFAQYIFEINEKDVLVNKVSTEEYLKLTNTKQAYRPRNSKLDKSKLEKEFYLLPSWKNATKRYSNQLKENE